jgi:hypothetical protein
MEPFEWAYLLTFIAVALVLGIMGAVAMIRAPYRKD